MYLAFTSTPKTQEFLLCLEYVLRVGQAWEETEGRV